MKKIEDIIATLTPEEIELHRDLIAECREREASITQIGETLQNNMEKLTDISLKILSDINKFYKISLELKESCEKAKTNMGKDSLALIPDEKFFYV